MQRTFRWSWLGAIALAAGPNLAAAQDSSTPSHTVREGDTLWDLARQYRGDPFLWPDIYRMNTGVVEDPHWIYPGETLRLSGGEAVASVPAQDTPAPDGSTLANADSSPAPQAAPVADRVAESPTAGTEAAEQEETPASLVALTTPDPDAEESAPLFGPRPGDKMHETLKAYTDQPYRALRRSEFYSSGFLTENQKLPFGKVLGPVTPPQIRALARNTNAMPYATIAVSAPKGASYQVGDTLLVVQIGREMRHFGDVVVPSGMVQITDTASGKYLARVVAVYGPIRAGQSVLPLEKFSETGSAKATPVSNGVRATLLGGSGRQDLKVPQMVVFLDKGRRDGVAPGDLFEVRRRPERLSDGSVRIDEVLATLQVVHVRERSATARLLTVVLPDIVPGSEAHQVAKLP
ncbi:MAG: LysM peptidoglycan-binding domain-containing protein [Gemmatimonadales bacterium]|nr:LysM peptidoglycan-binding domain-containing protein [Gemmatimonadales bacterium]